MKRLYLFITSLFFSLMLFMACNTTEKPMPSTDEGSTPTFDLAHAKTEIDKVNQAYGNFVSKGDSVGVANLYTIDAKFMTPNAPATVGRKNIQSAMAGLINSGATQVTLTAVQVWGNESMLTEEGVYTLGTTDGQQVDNGKYIVLWKKENGNWKLHRDIFNSDVAFPAAN